MAGKTDSVYWDTTIFYALLKGEQHRPGELQAIQNQYAAFDNGSLDIYTSTLTLVEICEGKLGEQERETLEAILKRSNFVWVELTPPVARLATDIRTKYAEFNADGNFKMVWQPPDAIQIASAIAIEAPLLWTLDTENKPMKKAWAMTAFAKEIKAEHKVLVTRPDTSNQQLTLT